MPQELAGLGLSSQNVRQMAHQRRLLWHLSTCYQPRPMCQGSSQTEERISFPSWENAGHASLLTRRIDLLGQGLAASDHPGHPDELLRRKSCFHLISSSDLCHREWFQSSSQINQLETPNNTFLGVQVQGYHQRTPNRKKDQRQQSKELNTMIGEYFDLHSISIDPERASNTTKASEASSAYIQLLTEPANIQLRTEHADGQITHTTSAKGRIEHANGQSKRIIEPMLNDQHVDGQIEHVNGQSERIIEETLNEQHADGQISMPTGSLKGKLNQR